MDVVEFIHEMSHNLNFNISYEINGQSTQAKMMINIADLKIDSKKIFSTSYLPTSWPYEKYKNLFAITSTSKVVADIKISFEKYHENKIETFLVKRLKFEILKMKKDKNNIMVSKEFVY